LDLTLTKENNMTQFPKILWEGPISQGSSTFGRIVVVSNDYRIKIHTLFSLHKSVIVECSSTRDCMGQRIWRKASTGSSGTQTPMREQVLTAAVCSFLP